MEYWNIGVIGILTKSEIPLNPTKSGWWFLTFFYFPFHIWDVIRTPSFFKMGTLHHQPLDFFLWIWLTNMVNLIHVPWANPLWVSTGISCWNMVYKNTVDGPAKSESPALIGRVEISSHDFVWVSTMR
jgi:hypothetical protein